MANVGVLDEVIVEQAAAQQEEASEVSHAAPAQEVVAAAAIKAPVYEELEQTVAKFGELDEVMSEQSAVTIHAVAPSYISRAPGTLVVCEPHPFGHS